MSGNDLTDYRESQSAAVLFSGLEQLKNVEILGNPYSRIGDLQRYARAKMITPYS